MISKEWSNIVYPNDYLHNVAPNNQSPNYQLWQCRQGPKNEQYYPWKWKAYELKYPHESTVVKMNQENIYYRNLIDTTQKLELATTKKSNAMFVDYFPPHGDLRQLPVDIINIEVFDEPKTANLMEIFSISTFKPNSPIEIVRQFYINLFKRQNAPKRSKPSATTTTMGTESREEFGQCTSAKRATGQARTGTTS
jgi:hypothetical protein